MVAKTDAQVAREYIYTAAAGVGIVHFDAVPEDVSGIAIRFGLLTGQIVGRVLGGGYGWMHMRAVVELSEVTEDYTALDTAAAALQTAIDNTAASVTNGVIFKCLIVAPLQTADVAPGLSVKRAGFEVEIDAKGS
jgi:hypothetical protein